MAAFWATATAGSSCLANQARGRDVLRARWTNVFAMIQTLSPRASWKQSDRQQFDYIVVDEFHHSEANTYQAVL